MNHYRLAGLFLRATSQRRRKAVHAFVLVTVVVATALFCQTVGVLGAPPARVESDAAPVQGLGPPGIAPVGESAPELLVRPRQPGGDITAVWSSAPASGGPRAESLLYSNGQPLDDYGDPASQLSEDGLGAWKFVAAAADDFVLPMAGLPERNYRITRIRAAFMFYNAGSGNEDPSFWDAIRVAVYPNSGIDRPGGQPLITGEYSGSVVATQIVPSGGLTFETAGTCRPCFVVDIPVDLVLAKNVRYWLSLMPDYDAPPQTAWCLSSQNMGFRAQRGASFGPPFWNEITGNIAYCPGAPSAHSMQDLSFQLYGEELPPTQGACCDISTGQCTEVLSPGACTGNFKVFHPGTVCQFLSPQCAIVTGACCDDTLPLGTGCADGVSIAACQGPTQRFAEATLCDDLDPPCGTEELGACCLAGQACDDLSPTDCAAVGGAWHEGECAAFDCPPDNDKCINVITIENGTHLFNNIGATTDGPPLNPSPPECAPVNQDVWFRYVATCTGTVVVSLCMDTDYDSALAVYQGCACPPSTGPQIACDNDGCGSLGAGAVIAAQISQPSYRDYLDNVLYTRTGQTPPPNWAPPKNP